MNIDVGVTLIDYVYYKKQVFNVIIRIITTLLKIRDLDTYKYKSYKYVICDIHLKNIKNSKFVTSVLRREIHLIKNFKINMLLNNNVINSKNICINLIKKQTFIISIDVTISLKVKLLKVFMQRLIYICKIIVISLYSKITVFIYYAILSNIKNFLFELTNNVNFILFVYIINASIFVVIIKNNNKNFIQISRNFKLKRIIELNFLNVFQMAVKNSHNVKFLTVKKFKFTHQNK